MRVTKLFITFIIIGSLVSLGPDPLKAQANTDDGGNFGLGLMIGEPSGVSIKSWTTGRTAINVGAAWSLTGREEALHMHGDYLWHSWMEESDIGRLAFYYGVGGRFIFADDATAGVRIPLGLNYVFIDAPFDLFVEAVPIFDLAQETEFAGNGAVGVRYYF